MCIMCTRMYTILSLYFPHTPNNLVMFFVFLSYYQANMNIYGGIYIVEGGNGKFNTYFRAVAFLSNRFFTYIFVYITSGTCIHIMLNFLV